ncbi:MAG: hypothetical protein NTW86_14740 [Candidatus Sumerlaeota bacterium]|nr:hypothetical protein [Candidatus Sumerlaeota bacterium]
MARLAVLLSLSGMAFSARAADTLSAVCTIIDNDPPPSVSIGDTSVVEGDEGVVNASFNVNLSLPSGFVVTVNYATVDGTASASSGDYITSSGTVTFQPGVTSQMIQVAVRGDTLDETDETFSVQLSDPQNVALADSQGECTIVDDDEPSPPPPDPPLISISDAEVLEGDSGTVDAVFTVTLSQVFDEVVTVDYATGDGTASAAGGDYTALVGSVEFPAQSTIQTIVVKVNGDLVFEPDESFFVNLANPVNGVIADGQGVGTIRNDDEAPVMGPPSLQQVSDLGDGVVELAWSDPNSPAAQYLGFAWDIYAADWVQKGWNNTLWFPYPSLSTTGTLEMDYSGGYHAWVSSQYSDGSWFPCANPWTGIVYSGVPHTPSGLAAEDLGEGQVRLHWKPEIYGTWLEQIIVYKVGEGFITVSGATNRMYGGTFDPWTFVDYSGLAYDTSQADFFAGWADFTLTAPGDYWFFVQGVNWLQPQRVGEFGTAFVSVGAGG